MIDPAQLAALTPAKRAQVIYSTAQSELAGTLWRAALGDGQGGDVARRGTVSVPQNTVLDLLNALESAPAPEITPSRVATRPPQTDVPPAIAGTKAVTDLPILTPAPMASINGPNARYRHNLAEAEARSGIPASVIASIINAEAGKRRDGSWNPLSRNPRSSAAGLGQFLSGTWQWLAETRGSWLNGVARSNGWISAQGKVLPEARARLLALRFDPGASIHAIADFASRNLAYLERKGIQVRDNELTTARAAYLSHHLGLGDAQRFLHATMTPARARLLLAAQVGPAGAERRIATAGDPVAAHRQWLLGYIDRHIRPDRMSA